MRGSSLLSLVLMSATMTGIAISAPSVTNSEIVAQASPTPTPLAQPSLSPDEILAYGKRSIGDLCTGEKTVRDQYAIEQLGVNCDPYRGLPGAYFRLQHDITHPSTLVCNIGTILKGGQTSFAGGAKSTGQVNTWFAVGMALTALFAGCNNG